MSYKARPTFAKKRTLSRLVNRAKYLRLVSASLPLLPTSEFSDRRLLQPARAMNALSAHLTVLAQTAKPIPLFGNQWLALLPILGGVALLMAAVALVGRWLAATHPDAAPVARPASTAMLVAANVAEASTVTPDVMVAIIAAVATTCGSNARIASVKPQPPKPPTVEVLMGQWAIEGRRQIYSSHKIR